MPARRRTPPRSFREQALALAWGAWAELGVSGWAETHKRWAVDPEPLILFTAALEDLDPRLRDEATDWCIRNWRVVSRVRLKNLLRRQPEQVQEAFGEFAATVGTHAGITWPGATEERRFTVIGRSTLRPLDRPSLCWVRLRVVFGLGARTEVLRYFLADFGRSASVARIADVAGYLKRNVADECEALQRAGVLSVRLSGNRFYYSLSRRSELEAFIGPLVPVRPNWSAMLNVARELVELERVNENAPHRTLPVKVRSMVRRLEDDFDEVGIEPLSDALAGDELWPAVRAVGKRHLGTWAMGDWPGETVITGAQQ